MMPTAVRRTASYRLQLQPKFGFHDAAAVVAYLHNLGISHVYSSPVLQAAPGSTHGYDVVDPTRLSVDLGGPAGFSQLSDALQDQAMGLIIDIVPNHMGIGGRSNAWWWDVLEKGPHSDYAGYFDIRWPDTAEKADGTVLVPVLGDHYGRVLESGAIKVARQDGSFVVRYDKHEFPMSPQSVAQLQSAIAKTSDSGEQSGTGEGDRTPAFLDRLNNDPDALDEFLKQQHYRLAFWRTAREEIDYRRFFNIDTLVGLRTEDAEVFAACHGLVLQLIDSGAVDGLRIDHVDGLRDPAGYLHRLRACVGDRVIVVEKILADFEKLPPDWPVEGTSGYEFASKVNRLLVDPGGEEALTKLYASLTGDEADYAVVVRRAKHRVMQVELASEVDRLTAFAAEVCDHYRRHRDHTRSQLQTALRELMAAFPVYRTYAQPDAATSADDCRYIAQAVLNAASCRPDMDLELLGLLGEILVCELQGEAESELALRFAQVNAAVTAKGKEDTAFYRYHRFEALNEVGGDPGHWASPVEDFHDWCRHVVANWPETMLALSTHDTKRTADVRARLDVLSEIPADWTTAVTRWTARNADHWGEFPPDRSIEYMLYQTMVGAWPISTPRLVQFAEKAAREAKVHTSWDDPRLAYETAVKDFVTAVADDAGFVTELTAFIDEQQLVEFGHRNSLTQTALLLTCPGVPDFYQGDETWNLRLVDPDNRGCVDYDVRARLLAELDLAGSSAVALARHDEGASKLWLISRLCRHRRAHPEIYSSGTYEPLVANGPKQESVVAFSRGNLVVVVPRLQVAIGDDWAGTELNLPAGHWRDLLCNRQTVGGPRPLADLLSGFPVAVLERAVPDGPD